MASGDIPHTWCIFEHPLLEGGQIIPQLEPLYDNVNDAVEAVHRDAERALADAANLPGWFDWRMLEATFDDASVPAWGRTPFFYRGQSDFHFGFQPTMLRGLLQPDKVDAERLEKRQAEERRILELIFTSDRIEAALPGARDLSDPQRAAVARHYGAPSFLSDFSANLDVAAFFATSSDVEPDAIGVIYCLNLVELLSLSGFAGFIRGGRGVLGAFSTPFGETGLTVLVPGDQSEPMPFEFFVNFSLGASLSLQWIIVPECRRIEGQKGIFLEIRPPGVGDFSPETIASAWTFLRLICHKYSFRQVAGSYANLARGVLSHELMPPDDPIDSLLRTG